MKEKKIHITGSDVNHIKNVLRMRQGETILISAGDNLEYTCLVSEMEAEEVIADISYVQEWSCRQRFICFRDFQRVTRWR